MSYIDPNYGLVLTPQQHIIDQAVEEATDVLYYATMTDFPAEGQIKKVYVDKSTLRCYCWDWIQSTYVELSSDQSCVNLINDHTTNTDVHVTVENKETWNAKVSQEERTQDKTELNTKITTEVNDRIAAVAAVKALIKSQTIMEQVVEYEGTKDVNKMVIPGVYNVSTFLNNINLPADTYAGILIVTGNGQYFICGMDNSTDKYSTNGGRTYYRFGCIINGDGTLKSPESYTGAWNVCAMTADVTTAKIELNTLITNNYNSLNSRVSNLEDTYAIKIAKEFITAEETKSVVKNTKYYCTAALTATLPESPENGDELWMVALGNGIGTTVAPATGTTINGSTEAVALNLDSMETTFVFDADNSNWIMY